MAIRIRGGLEENFDKSKMLPRELAITYSGKMFFCYSAGSVKQLATKEDLQSMLDASDTAYSALIQLIADLENNPSELTNILNNITALQTATNEIRGSGVFSGLTVSAQSTPNMTVAVGAGIAYMPSGERVELTAVSSLTVPTADATNPRVDIAYVSSTKAISYLAGTAASSPVVPSLPSGGILLAEISVAANATTIMSANITDKRTIIKSNTDLAKDTSRIQDISVNITKYKTDSNTWNDAFVLAYNALPTNGGTILIPQSIEITSSIDLVTMGTKIVCIKGNGRAINQGGGAPSRIIKNGSFDGIRLGNGCSMEDISVDKKDGISDTGDGIQVNGICVSLTNVTSTGHGGDGIRVGNKTGQSANCNISRLTNVGAYGNGGYGVHFSDDVNPTVPDCNAGIIVGMDCRGNILGGAKFENCNDNNLYGVDCELNYGDSGIYIGNNAKGIIIYNPYTENPDCTYDIHMISDSKQCAILGSRSNTNVDRYYDESLYNMVIGVHGAKNSYPYVKSRINFTDLMMSEDSDTISGSYHWYQAEGSDLVCVVEGTDTNRTIIFDNASSGKTLSGKFTGSVDGSSFGIIGQDAVNRLISREPANTSTVIPANSTVGVYMTVTGSVAGDNVVATPKTAIPAGLIWCACCWTSNTVQIRVTNTTSADITLPATTWNVLLFSSVQRV